MKAAHLFLAVLALAAAALLARDIIAVPAHVPLDPNEGWNAYHALAAMAGRGLYPPPGALMINNYPPLSFFLVGALGRITGDMIVAGRIVSLLAFLGTACLVAAALAGMGAGRTARLLGALVFAAALLITSDYVAMDDPQMLGHAVQLGALLLVLRGRVRAAALFFAASLFIKHNLVALPGATLLWLAMRERRAAVRFAVTGLGAGLAGLGLFYAVTGQSLPALLAGPRLSSLANLRAGADHILSWSVPAILAALIWTRGPFARFTALYGGIAALTGVLLAAGDGVDANIFFDAIIALAFALGLAWERKPPVIAGAAALPLLAFLAATFADSNFAYTRGFAAESARDIAFLRSHPGPAVCEQLSLCYWAGKPAALDVFNLGEAIATGSRDGRDIEAGLKARHYAALQLEPMPFALGPGIETALNRGYRIHHAGDNGAFWLPRLTRAPAPCRSAPACPSPQRGPSPPSRASAPRHNT